MNVSDEKIIPAILFIIAPMILALVVLLCWDRWFYLGSQPSDHLYRWTLVAGVLVAGRVGALIGSDFCMSFGHSRDRSQRLPMGARRRAASRLDGTAWKWLVASIALVALLLEFFESRVTNFLLGSIPGNYQQEFLGLVCLLPLLVIAGFLMVNGDLSWASVPEALSTGMEWAGLSSGSDKLNAHQPGMASTAFMRIGLSVGGLFLIAVAMGGLTKHWFGTVAGVVDKVEVAKCRPLSAHHQAEYPELARDVKKWGWNFAIAIRKNTLRQAVAKAKQRWGEESYSEDAAVQVAKEYLAEADVLSEYEAELGRWPAEWIRSGYWYWKQGEPGSRKMVKSLLACWLVHAVLVIGVFAGTVLIYLQDGLGQARRMLLAEQRRQQARRVDQTGVAAGEFTQRR